MTALPFAAQGGRYAYDRRRFVEIGLTIDTGDVWSFRAMSEAIQRPVDGADPALQHALRILARDHQREFKNIRKVGYLRLSDEAIVGEAGNDRNAVHRKIKRASQRSSNIQQWDELADPYKREVDAHRSILSLMRHILKPASVRQIRQEVDKARDELDVDSTLRLFRRKQDT